MRILIATGHRGIVGGIETYLRWLMPALRARGHEVALLYEHPATGVGTVDGDGACGPAWWAGGGGRAEQLRRIAGWGPSVVYVQGLSDPDLEESLVDAFPAVLFAHGYYGACISGRKSYSLPGAQPCGRVFGIGCLALYFPRRCGGLNPVTMVNQYRRERRRCRLLPRYRAVAVASRHMEEEYRRHGVPDARLRLLPLFPPGTVPDPEPPPVRPCAGRVLMVGRLTDIKGGMILVEALCRAGKALDRPLILTVAGDGPERAGMKASAARAGLCASFTGWVGAARRTELMREADLLAVPSVWPEPFGLVGIEAGCVGLPAAAFDVGGVRDWLRPGVSGELAPGDPPTTNGLAAAVVRALADPPRLNRLRIGAWEVARTFRPEQHVDELERILDAARPPRSAEAHSC